MRYTLPCLIALGCGPDSTVELDIFLRQETLASVEAYPVQVVIDTQTDVFVTLELCDWEEGFLETVLTTTHARCPGPTTIRGVVAPFEGDCVDGAEGISTEWPTTTYGEGTVEVFDGRNCSVNESARLTIDPVE